MKKVLAVFLVGLAGAAICGAQAPTSTIEPTLFSSAPKIDGVLDEEVWKEAATIDSFVQISPDLGSPAKEQTQVKLGFDKEKLYIGFRMYYDDPETVQAVLLNRDPDLLNEDAAEILLDTFHDRRTAFLFILTAVGAQFDALVQNGGDDLNANWDGIWFSDTARTADGWSAELAIPFRTLRFPNVETQVWGANFGRVTTHSREYSAWQASEGSVPSEAFFRVTHAGELTGLQGAKQGRKIEIKPYVLAEARRSDVAGDDEDLDVGLDVRKNLTSQLTLDLTYNLDFAEAEADNQQVNLTRFPLYFPEKRDFFLEGSSLFYFGERTDPLKSADRIFFFSRRIGLTEDGSQRIPVLGGVKLSGQVGGLNLGLLNLTTDEERYLDRSGAERLEPQTNYSVLRLQKPILKESSIGLIYLNKEVQDGEDNSGMGVDWDFGITKHLKSGGFLAQTETPGLDGDDWAGLVDLTWQSSTLFARTSYTDIGDNFNPEMGFFPRLGIREWRGALAFITSPKVKGLRNVFYIDNYVTIEDQEGNLESQFNNVLIDIQWNNYVTISLKRYDYIEVLDVDFPVHPGVTIPAGRYKFGSYFIGFQTIPSKPVFLFGRYQFGDFYDGTFDTKILGMRLRPVLGLASRIYYERTDVELPVGDFEVELVSFSLTYAISTGLSGRALVEWRRDDNLNANVALKWIYRPGAAAYLVYNEFRDLFDRLPGVPEPVDRSLIAKVSFYF